MSEEEKKPKKRGGCLKLGCGTFIGFIVLGIIAGIFVEKWEDEDIEKCNAGVEEVCEELLKGDSDVSSEITNPLYKETFLEKKKNMEELKRKKAEEQQKVDALVTRMAICKRLIKENLKDPDSFKVLNSITEQMATGIIRYSATNRFGGRVQERFDCNKL